MEPKGSKQSRVERSKTEQPEQQNKGIKTKGSENKEGKQRKAKNPNWTTILETENNSRVKWQPTERKAVLQQIRNRPAKNQNSTGDATGNGNPQYKLKPFSWSSGRLLIQNLSKTMFKKTFRAKGSPEK